MQRDHPHLTTSPPPAADCPRRAHSARPTTLPPDHPPPPARFASARPLRIRSRPASLTVRHILPMPDTATEPLRGSHGGGARRAICFPPLTRPISAQRREAKAPAPGVDCRGPPATIRDRLRRKAADGGSVPCNSSLSLRLCLSLSDVFAHVPVTVT